MLTEEREALSKLLRERQGELGITFPLRLGSLSQVRRYYILQTSKTLHAAIIARQHWTNMHMHRHNLYLLSNFPHCCNTQHVYKAPIVVDAASLQPKKRKSSGEYHDRQSFPSVCVHAAPVLLSPVKTNGQINTWLTQVPWGKLMVRVFTYKLHPAETATFSAADSQFAGIYGNLLSLPIGTMDFYCW